MDKIMKKLFKTVGTRIAKKRQGLHLSQERLAEKSGQHRNYIGSVERAEKYVTLTTLFKITKALDLKLEELFKGF